MSESIVMQHAVPATADDLAALTGGEARYELVAGRLRMMSPAGGRHGRIAHKAGMLLGMHVLQARCGVVYAAETGFVLRRDPDTVRAPDVAYVSNAKAAVIVDDAGYVPCAPDLAIEVISPRDAFSQVEEKALDWLAAGTRLVLLIDPHARHVHAYRSLQDIAIFSDDAEIDAADVVPGWRLIVRELFD